MWPGSRRDGQSAAARAASITGRSDDRHGILHRTPLRRDQGLDIRLGRARLDPSRRHGCEARPDVGDMARPPMCLDRERERSDGRTLDGLGVGQHGPRPADRCAPCLNCVSSIGRESRKILMIFGHIYHSSRRGPE
jgi:hypothetical protein